MSNEEIKDTGVENETAGEVTDEAEALDEIDEIADADEQAELEEQMQVEAEALRRAELKKTVKKEIKEWVIALVTALAVVLVLRTFLFTVIRVDGDSMYPTLQNNERLFVTIADVKLGNIERNDVVICHYPERGNTYFVKRVVGVPGDVVYREKGVTYVNGEALDPMGLSYQIKYDYEPYTLGEDEYFCVGDNRYDSHDSRDWNDAIANGDVGPLDEDMIIGKVRFVIWPLNEIRAVE